MNEAMYVSYAKDIFIAINKNDKDLELDMNLAINLVKQAREAFS